MATIAVILIHIPLKGQSTHNIFSLIVLPDTQDYSGRYPKIFYSQTGWIKKHVNNLNILYVLHLGDITNNNSPEEWLVAKDAMSNLDSIVPYTLATGNHDLNHNIPRQLIYFNNHFPISKFEKNPGWGGTFQHNSIENSYCFFEGNSKKYMVLTLEFGPRNEVLSWADRLIKKYPDFKIIINTHCFTYYDNTRVGKGDRWNPHSYSWLQKTKNCNDGDEIWHKLIKRNKNIFLVLSGHIKGDGTGRLFSKGDHGNRVAQIAANFQSGTDNSFSGRNGYLRIMTFLKNKNWIKIKTYSPYLKKWIRTSSHDFTIDFKKGIFY